MNEKLIKAKEFIKENKMEVALIVTGVIGSGILTALGIKFIKDLKIENLKIENELLNDLMAPLKRGTKILPEFGVGELGDAIEYDLGHKELWVDKIPINDLGAIGDEIKKVFPDITDAASVWALMEVRPNNDQ